MQLFLDEFTSLSYDKKDGCRILNIALNNYYSSLDEDDKTEFGIVFADFLEEASTSIVESSIPLEGGIEDKEAQILAPANNSNKDLTGLPILITPEGSYVVKASIYKKAVTASKQVAMVLSERENRSRKENNINNFNQILEDMSAIKHDDVEGSSFDNVEDYASIFYTQEQSDIDVVYQQDVEPITSLHSYPENSMENNDDDCNDDDCNDDDCNDADCNDANIPEEPKMRELGVVKEMPNTGSTKGNLPARPLNAVTNIYSAVGFDDDDDDDDDYLDDFEVAKHKYKVPPNEETELKEN